MEATRAAAGIAPGISGVPETMLWALHNRASEASRADGVLADPECISIRGAIDYDFAGQFGDPSGSLAARAAAIDALLRGWLVNHPDGCVVSLGEGLETQSRRVDNGRMSWLSVDLPEAIELRERFMPPTDRFRHIAISAVDPAWMDAVDASGGVFVVAQGLLMYLDPAHVERLLCGLAERFPGATIVFDTVPGWFSRLTLAGLQQTPQYRLPPMPWGISRCELEPTLRQWHPALAGVRSLPYGAPRGPAVLVAQMVGHMPGVRHEVPCLAHVVVSQNIISRSKTLTPLKPDAGTLESVFAAATMNAGCNNAIAIASSQVIAKRVALGMAAAINPLRADHAEFARIVPEKVEAFSAAGKIMIRHSAQASRQMTRLASDAVMTAARAAVAMTVCPSPMALAQAQRQFAAAWFERSAANYMALGMLALNAQGAMMTPIRQTVTANAIRLRS